MDALRRRLEEEWSAKLDAARGEWGLELDNSKNDRMPSGSKGCTDGRLSSLPSGASSPCRRVAVSWEVFELQLEKVHKQHEAQKKLQEEEDAVKNRKLQLQMEELRRKQLEAKQNAQMRTMSALMGKGAKGTSFSGRPAEKRRSSSDQACLDLDGTLHQAQLQNGDVLQAVVQHVQSCPEHDDEIPEVETGQQEMAVPKIALSSNREDLDANQSRHLDHLPLSEPTWTSLRGHSHCGENVLDEDLPCSVAAGELLKEQQYLEFQLQLTHQRDQAGRASTLHALGYVSRQTGDFQQARQYLEQSLKMKHALHGDKDHPDTAATLHELGYDRQKEFDLHCRNSREEATARAHHLLGGDGLSYREALWLSQVLSAWLLVATALHWARARELYAGQADQLRLQLEELRREKHLAMRDKLLFSRELRENQALVSRVLHEWLRLRYHGTLEELSPQLLRSCFKAWHARIEALRMVHGCKRGFQGRMEALAAKMLARYLEATPHAVFLAWSRATRQMRYERAAQQMLSKVRRGLSRSMRERCRPYRMYIAFWILGLLNNFLWVTMNAGANSINKAGIGMVYLANVVPSLTMKLTGPYWFHFVSYRVRMVWMALLMVLSLGTVAWGESPYLKLVAFCSVACGMGEASLLAMASFYDAQVCLSAWSSGTGFSGIAGYLWSLTFDGLDICFQVQLMVALWIPVAWLFTFFVLLGVPWIDKVRHQARCAESEETQEPGAADGKGQAVVGSPPPRCP
eukprot:g22593.t1